MDDVDRSLNLESVTVQGFDPESQSPNHKDKQNPKEAINHTTLYLPSDAYSSIAGVPYKEGEPSPQP